MKSLCKEPLVISNSFNNYLVEIVTSLKVYDAYLKKHYFMDENDTLSE